MDPAEVVVNIVRDVALQGTFGASLAELWQFAQQTLPHDLDDFLKSVVWAWIRTHPSIICTDNGVPLSEEELKLDLKDLGERPLRVYATESEQWLVLTRQSKEHTPVGPSAFELLCAVSRARERGLTSVEIAAATGQDPRSLFGRVQLLQSLGLVRKFPVTKNNAHTNLVVFSDFCKDQHVDMGDGVINKAQLFSKVLEMARDSPNGLILFTEVHRRLELDNLPHDPKVLSQVCYQLEMRQCARRLYVHSPSNPEIQFKCIKFLKDSSSGEEVEFQGGEEEDEELPADENVDLNQVVETKASATTFNLFYPLETQIYATIQQFPQGIFSTDILTKISGSTWVKPFGMLIPMLATTDKTRSKFGWIALERGIDFVQKAKSYKYFTRITHCLYAKKPIPASFGAPSTAKDSATTLHDLNIKHAKPAGGVCSIILDTRGCRRPLFHGEKIKGNVLLQAYQGEKKRGRPPKNPNNVLAPPPAPVYVPQKSKLLPISKRQWRGGHKTQGVSRGSNQLDPGFYTINAAGSPVKADPDAPVVTAGAEAPSFAMDRRLSAIMAILEQNEGAVEGGIALARKLDAHLQDKTSIDRKTIARCLGMLETQGKITKETVTVSKETGHEASRTIIYLSSLDPKGSVVSVLRDQVISRLQARRVGLQPSVELPQEAIATENVSKLFEHVENKPQRLRTLLTQTIRRRRKQQHHHQPQPKTRFGPRASTLINIPGRSDPKQFAVTTAPLKRPRDEVKGRNVRSRELPIDEDLLFRSVIISRTLYGKNETSIDWDLVTSCVHGLTNRRARQRWIEIRDNYGGAKAVQKATYQWENLFLRYYKQDEIKVLDRFSLDFDLRYYVDFWRKHYPGNLISQPLWKHSHSSLLSRQDFEQSFGQIKTKSAHNPLDSIYTMPSMVKVEEHLASTSFSYGEEDELHGEDFTPDEQLVRSIIGTDEDKYDMETAERQLSEIGEERAKQAVDSLLEKKCIIYLARDSTRVIAGRNYTFSDKMLSTLAFKYDAKLFDQAKEFESLVFSSKTLPVKPEILDNHMVALLELCALDKVYLSRPGIKTGRLMGSYQSRKIPRELLDFGLEISAKGKPGAVAMQPHPQQPLWAHGTQIWSALAKKIIVTIQQKPGITASGLSEYLFGFDKREIDAVLAWLHGSDAIGDNGGKQSSNDTNNAMWLRPRFYHFI